MQLNLQRYLVFNVFGEEYLCLLKRFLILSIRGLYFIQFLFEIYIYRKGVQNFFGYNFLGTHTIQTLPKYIWMWHCDRQGYSIFIQFRTCNVAMADASFYMKMIHNINMNIISFSYKYYNIFPIIFIQGKLTSLT